MKENDRVKSKKEKKKKRKKKRCATEIESKEIL